MFDLQHTPVSITIERISELIDSVATQNTKTTGQITPFHSRAIPCIPIKDYLERVAKFVYLENDTLIAVLVYLDRISRAQPSLLPSPYNIHRLAITAIVVAHKFNSDIFFNNARYSKVSQKKYFIDAWRYKHKLILYTFVGRWYTFNRNESIGTRNVVSCKIRLKNRPIRDAACRRMADQSRYGFSIQSHIHVFP